MGPINPNSVKLEVTDLIGGTKFKLIPYHLEYMLVFHCSFDAKSVYYLLVNLKKGVVSYQANTKKEMLDFLNTWEAIKVKGE